MGRNNPEKKLFSCPGLFNLFSAEQKKNNLKSPYSAKGWEGRRHLQKGKGGLKAY